MSTTPFPFLKLPVELQELVLSFIDYPTIITILTVNKYIHHLAKEQNILRDPAQRIFFLLSLENAPENINAPHSPTFPDDDWRWPNHSPRKMYICFLCNKMKPLRKFAHGQCFRMMLDDDYSQRRKRFCLKCGVGNCEPGGLISKSRKYVPGAMMNSVDHGYMVHLCGGCGQWSDEFFCMKDKLCFPCTEIDLEEPEKYVRGYQEGPRKLDSAAAPTADDELMKKCGVWEELLARFRLDEETWPRRPPCCRRCGGRWRFNPRAFGWQYKPEATHQGKVKHGSKIKRPVIWRHGYKISGCALQEITHRGQRYSAQDYMSWFCPFPNKSWRSRLDYSIYKDVWDDVREEVDVSVADEVLR